MAASNMYIYRNYSDTDTVSNSNYREDEALPSIETLGWEREGYVFLGYNTSRDGSGTSYAVGEVPWGGVYAQWIKGSDAFLNYDGLSYFYGKLKNTFAKPEDITIPTNVSAFTNDAGYLTSADIPEGASAYTGTISAVGTTASAGTNNGFARGDHVHNITGSTITTALGYTPYNSTNPDGYKSNSGTVTSVRVQATSPVQSSTSTAQTGSLNTTISLANGYGDTKNPYGTKTANYVLAGPSSGSAAAPTFRKLTSADIPDLSSKYLTSYTETDPVFTASPAHGITSANITAWNNKQNALTPGTGISISNNTISTTAEANVQSNWTETNTSSDAYIKNKPTKVSAFTNDAGYITSSSVSWGNISGSLEDQSDLLDEFGEVNASIAANGELISQMYDSLADKQDILTAGSGISISNDTISVDNTIARTSQIPTVPTNVSSFTNDAGYLTSYTETDPVFTASAAHGITSSNITAWNGKMDIPSGGTAGQVLTKTASGYGWANASGGGTWGSITGTLSDQTDLQTALNAKQNTLTAGSGISITNNTVNTVFTDARSTQRSLPDLATSIITGYRTTIYAASWSTDKVEYYGKYWYKYDLALNNLNKNLITSVPIIGISGVDEYTPPTDAEQEAYNIWEYAFADTYNNSINFISEVKPTSDFSVIILGVI